MLKEEHIYIGAMKSNISLISCSLVLSMAVMFLMLVAVNQVKAQATCGTPANIANFGLDGDVHANTPVSIMGDSWFYSNVFPGSGIGVIGTTAATAIPAISASAFNSIIQGASNSQGRNRTYSQRMSVPYLTQVNGMTLIDAFAARDNISPDSTAFTASNKNGDNPTIWTLGVSTVPNKNTYEWTPASYITFTTIPDPYVSPLNTTTYSVQITNEWGCKTSLSTEVAVVCDTLLVPTGFSPNNDGVNDGYIIDGIGNYPGNKLWVYNRWGKLVYKAHDYNNSWDAVGNVSGVSMGQKVPSGTYYFILDLNDQSKPRAGYLIIRGG